MEFLLLIVGACLGVAADRIYRRWVESVPTVRVQSSCAFSWEYGQRFNLVITNIGFSPLPPYDVALYNPHHGTIRCFWKTEESERLPGQREVFTFSISQITAPNPQQHIEGLRMMLTFSRTTRQ